jgi:putative flippase GtrA
MSDYRGWQAKLVRYGLTGALAAVVDVVGFAILLASDLALPLAAALSFLAATVVNYLLSAQFAFGAKISARGYLRFLAIAGLGLVVNVIATILAAAAGLPAVLAKFVGILIAFGINFLLNLILVFPRSAQRKGEEAPRHRSDPQGAKRP